MSAVDVDSSPVRALPGNWREVRCPRCRALLLHVHGDTGGVRVVCRRCPPPGNCWRYTFDDDGHHEMTLELPVDIPRRRGVS